MSVFLDLPPLGVCLENATRSGRAVYSVVQINVVKGCVRVVLVHATFNHVYFDSRVLPAVSSQEQARDPLSLVAQILLDTVRTEQSSTVS